MQVKKWALAALVVFLVLEFILPLFATMFGDPEWFPRIYGPGLASALSVLVSGLTILALGGIWLYKAHDDDGLMVAVLAAASAISLLAIERAFTDAFEALATAAFSAALVGAISVAVWAWPSK